MLLIQTFLDKVKYNYIIIPNGVMVMKIVTDCAAELTNEEAEALDVQVAPLFIQFPDGEIESNQLSPDDFYQRLKNMAPRIPTTAQPSAGIFADIYRKLAESGEEVISIHISSGLSGTIESARLGATQLNRKVVDMVDSLTLSGGERFQVLAAALAARAGRSKEFILDRLERIRQLTEVIFTLETLEYLRRGGRIGRVQALAGSLLHIKPIIHVDKADGKYSTVGKERTIPKALEAITSYVEKNYGNTTPLWVSVMHGQFIEQANQLSKMVREKMSVGKLEILRISPVLGVHTGPGVVGMAVVPIDVMDGLE
jgi:fatty acid kinase fatty acid binding subunit